MVNAPEYETRDARPKGVAEGGCTCGQVRYRLLADPLIVHGCHCTLCQKQSGAAYAVNALIEEEHVDLISGTIRDNHVATSSGAGQTITRCAECGVAVWSKYHAMPKVGNYILFIRAGTLDLPATAPPDVHIYTTSKQPHVLLSGETPVFEGFYDVRKVWSADSLGRYSRIVSANGR